MKSRTSLQAEILTSLTLVMFVATGLLALSIVYSLTSLHRLQSERDAAWLVNVLLAEGYAARPSGASAFPGIVWWKAPVAALAPAPRMQGVEGDTNKSRKRGVAGEAPSVSESREYSAGRPERGAAEFFPDPAARELAAAAYREGRPLLSNALPWEPVYFAMLDLRHNEVLVARLPASLESSPLLVSRVFLFFLLAADTAVFVGLGFYLLRGRVIVPLQNLACAARTVADGELDARVPEEGSLEIVNVAQAFNAMTSALARRSAALEAAVRDLSSTNDALRTARAGLERAERLAAVGKLAAGVAHEVGNPIGALLAFLDLARRDPGISEATREQLQRAGREGERVRRILRQLLDFSRPASYAPHAVDVAAVAREMGELISTQKSFGSGVLALHVEGEVPPAFADPALVAQIVLNLLVNAADAVRDVVSPRIDIRIRVSSDANPSRAAAADGAAPTAARAFVECEVADNGPGVPEELRERIFDLFFTTKDPGHGTGIGLANSARFAEQMNGELKLMPSQQGAFFVLRLPVLDSTAPLRVKERE